MIYRAWLGWACAFSLTLLAALSITVAAKSIESPSEAGDEMDKGSIVNLQVTPEKKTFDISPLFFGSNILYWIEDDIAMQDGRIAGYLKEMQLRLLRFPGGTVADNYHWETNTLHNPNDFPYVAHGEAPSKMDTDKFIALCREVGAEPLLVVNTASWFRTGDIEGGAREAAAWVEYANKQNNYNVKYWAIGNETYHHVLMGAEEYAKVVVAYAKAMKAVDPTIMIGANGHWDFSDVGTHDRIKPGSLQMLLQAEASHNDKASKDAFEEFKAANVENNRNLGNPPWWSTMLGIAGESLDFAIIHWYFPLNYVGPKLENAVRDLNRLLKAKLPGRDIPIALTEWNLAPNSIKGMPEHNIGLAIAEAGLRFLDGGVDMSAFWPLRMGGNDNRALLGINSREPRSAYHVFRLLSTAMQAHRVSVAQSSSDVYTFAAVNDDQSELTVYVVHRKGSDAKHIVIDTGSFTAASAVGQVLTSLASGRSQVVPVQLVKAGNSWTLDLPPNTLAVLQFATH